MPLSQITFSSKILIADDSKSQRSLLGVILQQYGFAVVFACDGREAVDRFIEEQPDLVILDIVMPGTDGIEAAKQIRSLPGESYTPIIFITSVKNHLKLNQCFDVGGDDYIDKPFNEEVLLVKINSLLRIKSLYQAQLAQKKELLKYQEMAEQEQLIAANLYKNILRVGFVDLPILRYSLSPMALFNGDILLSAKSSDNQLYVLLGDFTGHGLSASIGASPTAEIFYRMVHKGFAAIEIASEINRKLCMLLPTNMFLAATLVTLNSDARMLQIISCGLPEHLLLNTRTKEIRTISSVNLPLGILDHLEPVVESIKISSDDYLYLFSDGLIEFENSDGEQFTINGVLDCLRGNAASHFESILAGLLKHSGGLDQKDDVTLVELRCDLRDVSWPEHVAMVKTKQREAMDWKASMSFTVQTLKNLQPVPLMVNLLMEIQGLQQFQNIIFQIVNELFVNALDYGLLAMDSSLKQSVQGLRHYNQIKSERLLAAEQGEIKFVFNHHSVKSGGRLVIRVKDSGPGFNISTILQAQTGKLHGIARIQALCSELEYVGSGNQVNAVFEWCT